MVPENTYVHLNTNTLLELKWLSPSVKGKKVFSHKYQRDSMFGNQIFKNEALKNDFYLKGQLRRSCTNASFLQQ